MLIAHDLHRVFRIPVKTGFFKREYKEVFAVAGLNLKLRPGSIVGLLGLNGAGKTTTIRMLCGLLEPTKGSITVDGCDVVREPDRVKQMVNVVMGGERNLYYRLTGYENLWYFAELYGLPRKEVDRTVRTLLDQVGLSDAANKPVEKYSRGMKQRLHIARGLINQPKYLMLDEPTIGLDVPIAKHIRSLVYEQAKQHGRAVLLTSHNMQEVEELCDEIHVIDRGQLRISGTAQDLKRLTGQQYHLALRLNGIDLRTERALRDAAGELSTTLRVSSKTDGEVLLELRMVEDVSHLFVNVVHQHGWQLLELKVTPPTLQDAIIALAR